SLAQYITSADYSTFIFDHDQILFDQRGTGYSTPSLQCKELIQLQYSTSDVSEQNYDQQAKACHDRLVSQGIDLNGFNSLQNAADVNDLVHALGYQKMTIYGVSYGTRLDLTVMRLYPGVVRDAVLDSVYQPNHNRADLPSDAQRVFNVLFQGCAKDPHCNATYPNLQSVFYNLVDTLNAHPVSFPTTDDTTGQSYTLPLSGNDLVSWLFSSFYVTQFIPMLPQTIFQVQTHNYTQLSMMEGLVAFDDTISDGFFYSVECSEDWPFLTKQDITKSLQGITPQIAAVFGPGEQQEYDVCQFWNVQKVPAAQKQPVVSSLPTLVLSGEYDPITPPSNGQETANNLSNSYFFIFPGQGHGQEYSSDCSNSIINAFEDDPSQKPSGACITQMTEPAFV
ncbi:MAG: alpha/beta fold hydrolase, partial [Ktedonobacteraceae bacterium]